MSDLLGVPLEIVDESGIFPSNSESGSKSSATFTPKGKKSKKSAIKLKFSRNEDGTNHVDLIKPGISFC